MAPLCAVSFVASPPVEEMIQICAAESAPAAPPPPPASAEPATASRELRKAIDLPSGDHAGLRSRSWPRNFRAPDPSALAIQIDVTRLLSFHFPSSETEYRTRVPSGEMRGAESCTRSRTSSIVIARRVCEAAGDAVHNVTARAAVQTDSVRPENPRKVIG